MASEAEMASKATILFQKLTSTKEEMKESLPRGTDSMPPAELHFCSGLAYTSVVKGGIGLSVEKGRGFVIRKIQEPPSLAVGEGAAHHPSWSWSAPLFINVVAGGVGLTLGYSEIDSVIVLDTPEAVQSFTRGQNLVDTDITGAAGSSMAAHLPATAANLSNMQLSDKTFSFSVAHGLMVDVSLTGLHFGVDTRANAALYGANVSPAAILDGGVEAPPAFKELYDALDKSLQHYYEHIHELSAEQTAAVPPPMAPTAVDKGEGEIAPAAPEPAGAPADEP